MIFDDSLLQKGEQGGREAAGLLGNTVRQYLEHSMPDLSSDCKIITRVYANIKGLADTCYRAQIVDQPSTIEDFARGFTRSRHLFDFVDVGSGKDRADGKLSEVFKLHFFDCHCRLILFGGSHDNGYARLLEEITTDPMAVGRICLLEGFPFEREILSLSQHFKTIKFGPLFRSTKINLNNLNNNSNHYIHHAAAGHAPPMGMLAAAAAAALSPLPPPPAPAAFPTIGSIASPMAMAMPTPLPTPQPTPTATVTHTHSWASAAAAAASAPSPTASSARLSNTPATIARNRYGQRIDSKLDYDRAIFKEVKERKLCNMWYLRNRCTYDDCPHLHDVKISAAELATLRAVARLQPCRYGSGCEDVECINGHRCPMGSQCTRASACRYSPEMHFADVTAVRSIRI
ncbi:MAG: hypothetical protein M1826_001944 [Phylliscum demangeonii]|nr:MAG: hypothetical protein M1826_001944 [Phylliscum demangeonii]